MMRDSNNIEEAVDLADAELLDYPSVGQIALALREQDIIPIFAAEQGARRFYDVSGVCLC